jgi:hypothetical protein
MPPRSSDASKIPKRTNTAFCRLREKGHRITLVDDTQFWRLVASSLKARGASRRG